MVDPNLKPPSPKSFCEPGVYITGCPLLPSPTPTTELRLGPSQQNESSPITQDQMAASVLTQYKEPSFFTETHWVQKPNCLLPSYPLDSPLGISSQYYLDNTSPTKPGRKSSLPTKRPFAIDICLLMKDGQNTLDAFHH